MFWSSSEDNSKTRLSFAALAHQNRFLSARRLKNECQPNLRGRVSRETVNRYLLAAGYKAYRPCLLPKLRRRHKPICLRWARYCQQWNKKIWHHIHWSDESKFNVFNNDGQWSVSHVPNKAYRDDCVVQTVQEGGGSVLVWGAFSFAGKMDLHVWDQSISGVAYCDRILIPKVIPQIQALPGLPR